MNLVLRFAVRYLFAKKSAVDGAVGELVYELANTLRISYGHP